MTTVGYSDFQKTSSIHIVLPEFPNCQCLHIDILEGSNVPVCYLEIFLTAQKLVQLANLTLVQLNREGQARRLPGTP